MNSEGSRGVGLVVINSALALQMSWVVALFLLAGAPWATAELFASVHWGAIAFMLVAPLGYGLSRILAARGRGEAAFSGEVNRTWLLEGLAPLALYAVTLRVFLAYSTQLTTQSVIVLMFAVLPLIVYGVYLLLPAGEQGS